MAFPFDFLPANQNTLPIFNPGIYSYTNLDLGDTHPYAFPFVFFLIVFLSHSISLFASILFLIYVLSFPSSCSQPVNLSRKQLIKTINQCLIFHYDKNSTNRKWIIIISAVLCRHWMKFRGPVKKSNGQLRQMLSQGNPGLSAWLDILWQVRLKSLIKLNNDFNFWRFKETSEIILWDKYREWICFDGT